MIILYIIHTLYPTSPMWTVLKLPTLGPRPYASHGLHAQAETASLGQNKGWISDKNLHLWILFLRKPWVFHIYLGLPWSHWDFLEKTG